MSHTSLRLLSIALLTAFAGMPAFAHTGQDHVFGLTAGLAHPLSGIDHVLAMVSVGALAGLRGGRALWALPMSFVVFLVGGAGLAVALAAPISYEAAIALSLVVLGGLLAAGIRPPLAALCALIGAFAIAHGYGHGAELPGNAAAAGYFAGFILTTSLLHGLGIALALFLGSRQPMRRSAGVLTGLAGLILLVLQVL